jgi:lysophospholipase L1-like esterase
VSDAAQRRGGTAEAWWLAAPFALSTLLAFRLDTGVSPIAVAVFAGLTLLVPLGVRAQRARGRSIGPFVALAVLATLLAVPELGLRSAGFRNVSGIEFGYPSPTDFLELEPDEELFWKMPSDAPGTNSLGFSGPEPRVPKPAGTRRVLFLGDSCLYQGHPEAWPEIAARALGLDGVNLSIAGYSTHQGRLVAQKHGERLEPDFVVVCYGWNDHWLARGTQDSVKRIDARHERLYRSSRLLQALRKLRAPEEAPVLDVGRVPPEEYVANLAAIVRQFRARNVRVMLVTAPTVHDLTVPPYLLKYNFGTSAEQIVRVHEQYVELTREVASAEGAELFDLAALCRQRPDRIDWFLGDGIHFTEQGRTVLAGLFLARTRELGWDR